ncbi:MAG: polyphosphate kinase 1 [Chitinophagales bacterium]|nr:polyphosphate kinase 1 [Chitinophagales bacterium]MDW8419337.1 polyphosphate kinase 1 [Chitinophagales bacterium]
MKRKNQYINREISWLSFNDRVLQEAADPNVPLLERLRFLGIFSNNQDEFFRVRIATLKRLITLGKRAKATLHYKPKKILNQVQKIVLQQGRKFEEIYEQIHNELAKKGIHIINEKQLNPEQGEFVKNYFNENVRHALVPIMLQQVKTFPELKDKAIYLAIRLSVKNKPHLKQFALAEIPTDVVNRFLILPNIGKNKYIILLDDVIRYNLREVFVSFPYNHIEAYTIKVTRDAELDIDNDISHSFLEKISKSVKARQKGAPVRFVYDKDIPRDLFEFIKSRMKLKKSDNILPGGRYHNFKDFMRFPKVGDDSLYYERLKPIPHKHLPTGVSMFDVLRKRDVMLHYPYQSFTHFLDLLREAAIDPYVRSIKITLYRVATKSLVINALINAAKNGKQVLAVVELQARFDEEANIKWAQQLQDEGIQVIYGVPGLKVHSKLCLITRYENGKLQHYANITTGNYNEQTAQVYADDSLLTHNPAITKEVEQVFEFFERNYKVFPYKHLILSPIATRQKFTKLIENEIEFARKGEPAEIFIKMNSLVDEEMIDKLYKASRAGVKIRAIVRSICALIPGVPGMSDNIEVISLVDKFLEHSRIFIFRNGGNELYFISSADWMTRNLDYRVETGCPIYDKNIQRELRQIMEIQWSDNTKTRIIDAKLSNRLRQTPSTRKIRAQEAIYEMLK